MPNDRETRDIAVKAETTIAQHLTDCASFRGRIDKSLEGIFKRMDDQDKKLARQTWILGLIMGGLITLSRILDAIPAITSIIGNKPL